VRQFDLVDNPSDRSGQRAPYFVVLQSHYLGQLDSVVVAPVLRDARRAISSLDVEADLLGEKLVIALGEIFSIERGQLKAVRGSAKDQEDAIRRGLDRLFTGF
jgi:toxin CcdB